MASSVYRKPLSIYIHIPFCQAKCVYCDFYSVVGQKAQIPAFIDALEKEITTRIDILDVTKYEIDTIFFGGGTPSMLQSDHFDRILNLLFHSIESGEDMEISLESNPGEVDLKRLYDYKAVGINRLSIGMQSFQPKLLKFMSRIHSAEESMETFNMAREAGFSNISADLMFAVPGQTISDWVHDLKQIVTMAPEHLSTYSLTVEEGTALHRWVRAGHVRLIEETDDNAMYREAREFLLANDYACYEISNHAREGNECRHNLNYWKGVEYLGFGPSAHSFINQRRFWNIRDLGTYMKHSSQFQSVEEGGEIVNESMAKNEMILTRLRLTEGLDLNEYSERFSEDFLTTRKRSLQKWVPDLLEIDDHHLKVREAGWALVDEISADLMRG